MKTILLAGAMILLAGNSALAQFVFTTQNRSVTATGKFTIGIVTLSNSQTLTAPDFSDFNQTVSQTANTPAGTPAAAGTGTASQLSKLAQQLITASGTVTANGSSTFPTSAGEGSGLSNFQTTFTLPVPATLVFGIHVEAHRSEVNSPPSDQLAAAMFSFTGPATNLQSTTSLPGGSTDSSVFFNQVLDLPAGAYTVSISANVDAFGARTDSSGDGTASASYSESISFFVPEPSSLALVTTAALAVIVLHRAFRRH